MTKKKKKNVPINPGCVFEQQVSGSRQEDTQLHPGVELLTLINFVNQPVILSLII